jgi:hypothetical protein
MMIRLETSKRNGVDNFQGDELSQFTLNWARHIANKFPLATMRTSLSPIYNCHGFVFACRRTRIEKSESIQIVLTDDKYTEVNLKDVLPGDIVIYYSNEGDPNHSGVVLEYDPPRVLTPLICSKWGSAGEFIHALQYCPKEYGPNHKYYRCTL